MIRDIITNKWFIGAIAFLIIFAGACYLWYRYDTAPYRQEAVESAKLLRQREATQKAETENAEKQAADVTPAESTTPTAEKPITEMTDEVLETGAKTDTAAENVSASKQGTENAEEVRVSPHGFGPFPDIPPDYPTQDIWDYSKDYSAEAELLIRVQIKLWTQGIQTLGGNMSNGLAYPTLPGVVYIEWDHKALPDGTVEKRVSRVRGDPYMGKILSDIMRRKGKLVESDIPKDIEVRERGIDPYVFLNLK